MSRKKLGIVSCNKCNASLIDVRNVKGMCINCYNFYYYRHITENCRICEKPTQNRGLTIICPECQDKKLLPVTAEDIKLMKMFLIKRKWNLLNKIDILRMIDLYLVLGYNYIDLLRFKNGDEVIYILDIFQRHWDLNEIDFI